MEQELLIAIVFSLSMLVIGQGVANGAMWLMEKIEEICSKRKK
jgi:hypothetical protein